MTLKSSIFGPNVGVDQIEDAAEATIKLFLEDHLAEAERQRELPPQTLLPFKEYTNVNEFRNWASDETPVCVIISPGRTGDDAIQEGDGTFRTKFYLGVAAIVGANNRVNTNKLARIYGAMLRQLILQHPDLGGLCSGVWYDDEKYNDPSDTEDRANASAQVIFTVEVPDLVNPREGLLQPSENPYELDPTVPVAQKAEVKLEKKP